MLHFHNTFSYLKRQTFFICHVRLRICCFYTNWQNFFSFFGMKNLSGQKSFDIFCFMLYVNQCSHPYIFAKDSISYIWIIWKLKSDKIRNICLSVILEFCLLLFLLVVGDCSASTAYTSLCRGLKVQYIILVYPVVTEFLISNTAFCCGMETLPYVWK